MPHDADAPTWRDSWDDKQRLPLLMRIDVMPRRAWPGRSSSSSRGRRRRPVAAPGIPTRFAAWARDDATADRADAPDRSRARASAESGHRADRRALAHGAADGDRQRVRVQHAQRGAGRAQRAVASRRRAPPPTARSSGRCSSCSGPRNLPDVWLADGAPHAWQDGDAAITAVAVDESAKIDLNAAATLLLKGLLQNVGGLDAERGPAARRRDRRLAGPRRPQAAERRGGSRLPRRGPQVRARERAIRLRRRTAVACSG